MANWEAELVKDTISEIDDGVFVLPVIQRRLVWDEEKMELLFDTLLKSDSFGGIMVLEEEKGSTPLFAFRAFTKDGNPMVSINLENGGLSHNHFFVIDGQQRLQSFYIGLTGSIDGKVLYFDLYSDYTNLEFDFKFENDASKLPKQASDRDNGLKECFWYLVSDLYKQLKKTYDEDPVSKSIIKSRNITDDIQKDHINGNVKRFYKNIFQFKNIGIAKVVINTELGERDNRQRIVELFRRLNDGGTRLSPFDLSASILKGFDWRMEKFLDDTLKDYKDIGLTQDNLIKLIFILRDDYAKEMVDIEIDDASFAVDNKERISKTLTTLKKFLHAARLYHYYKDGSRSFIPLFFIAYHIFHKSALRNEEIELFFDNYDTNNKDYKNYYRWIYLSLLNGVFRSEGAGWIPYKTGVKKILNVVKDFKNKEFPWERLFVVYKNHPLIFFDKINENLINLLDRSFLFYILYDRESYIRTQDIDHIHPSSLLIRKGKFSERINVIENFQLLDVGTNRWLKSDTPLRDWITNSVENKELYQTRHLIPKQEELWELDNYEGFVTARRKLITDKINAALRI